MIEKLAKSFCLLVWALCGVMLLMVLTLKCLDTLIDTARNAQEPIECAIEV